ncbi:MAG: hypothetical protein IT427_07185 [Pirellulales bacterium]|nr:hypothetical protein [Pirellulales bacterium]
MFASTRVMLSLPLICAACASHAFAQNSPRFANVPAQSMATDARPEFTLLLFWKENNVATQAMMSQLKSSLPQKPRRTEWSSINVTDPANRELVERYKVSRAPMPMVMCVAANGAITGAVPDRINDQTIDKLLVTPTMTQVMKALQEDKLVLVHVKSDTSAQLPQGVADFAADPMFQARTTMVSLHRDDSSEKRFLADMSIDAKTPGSMVSLLAPPGVLVGKYTTEATKEQIGADLHTAGKCCNDPNCIHNQKKK